MVVGALVAAMTVGCATFDTQVVKGPFEPDSASSPYETKESKSGPLTIKAEASGSTLTVRLAQTQLCRTVAQIKGSREVTEERKLSASGRSTQYLLGTAAVVGAIGAVVGFAPCQRTETDEAGQEFDRDCTSEEQGQMTAIGVGSLIVVGVSTPALIANAVRGTDVRREELAQEEDVGEWTPCDIGPAASQEFVVQFEGGSSTTATTDNSGIAQVDLSGIASREALIRVAPGIESRVSLEGTDAESAWLVKRDEQRAAAEQRAQEQQIEGEQDQARREAEQQKAAQNYLNFMKSVMANKQKFVQGGQSVVRNAMKAPSTTRFVSGDVVGICPEGNVVVSYKVDSQNSFGAMMRENHCAIVNANSGRAMVDANCQWSAGVAWRLQRLPRAAVI